MWNKKIFYPQYCVPCAFSWIGKRIKECCPLCGSDDNILTVKTEDLGEIKNGKPRNHSCKA